MKKLLFTLSVAFSCGLSQAQIYFSENWDQPASWALNSLDTDTLNWGVYTTQAFASQDNLALSQSWVQAGPLTPDNFIISPPINLSNVSSNIALSFKIGSPETTASGYYKEYLSVYVSDGVTQPAVAAAIASPVHSAELAGGDTLYTITYDITTLAAGKDSVMLWFRHHNCTDMNFIVLDDISVYGSASLDENTLSASVYPNPATDVLNIKMNEEVASVVITALDGKTVATETSASVNISGLNTGMYLYTITGVSGKVAKGNFVKN
jgi:hypothetical protein